MAPECSGPVSLGSEEMGTINGLARIIIEIGGKDLRLRHVPGPLGVRGSNSDNRLIREHLGMAPGASVREGLTQTQHWVSAAGPKDKLVRHVRDYTR